MPRKTWMRDSRQAGDRDASMRPRPDAAENSIGVVPLPALTFSLQ